MLKAREGLKTSTDQTEDKQRRGFSMLSCTYIIGIYIIGNSTSLNYFIENGNISVHLFQQN